MPFPWGKLGPYLTQFGLGRAYLCTKWHLDPSSCLATRDMGRKLGVGCAPFWERGAGSPCNTTWPGPMPTFIPSGMLTIQKFGHKKYVPRSWRGCCAPFLGVAGSRSNTIDLTQCRLGWGLPPFQVAPWSIQPFGHNTWTSQRDSGQPKTKPRFGQL